MVETDLMPMEDRGTKHDDGKSRMDLISPSLLFGLGDVLEYGVGKYNARNWEKGIEWGRLYGACQRHLWAFWAGEDIDPESGMNHLDHAICNLMMLRHFYITRQDLDTRGEEVQVQASREGS